MFVPKNNLDSNYTIVYVPVNVSGINLAWLAGKYDQAEAKHLYESIYADALVSRLNSVAGTYWKAKASGDKEMLIITIKSVKNQKSQPSVLLELTRTFGRDGKKYIKDMFMRQYSRMTGKPAKTTYFFNAHARFLKGFKNASFVYVGPKFNKAAIKSQSDKFKAIKLIDGEEKYQETVLLNKFARETKMFKSDYKTLLALTMKMRKNLILVKTPQFIIASAEIDKKMVGDMSSTLKKIKPNNILIYGITYLPASMTTMK